VAKDRRAHGFALRRGRATLEIPIDFETSGQSFLATAVNIGLGGQFVASDRRFEIGDRFNLTFTLPDQPLPIVVGAEVRWMREDEGQAIGMGLRFVHVPIAGAAAIQEFLRRFDEDLTPSGPSI
jgi:uncharacterized protein (TIGR02266 family)